MAAGGLITAAAGAASAGGRAGVSDGGPTAGEATARVGTRLSWVGWGGVLWGGAVADCHKPLCQNENARVTINAPTTIPLKSIRVFTSAPDGRCRMVAYSHDNLTRPVAGPYPGGCAARQPAVLNVQGSGLGGKDRSAYRWLGWSRGLQ
jgi:hypothetical protein